MQNMVTALVAVADVWPAANFRSYTDTLTHAHAHKVNRFKSIMRAYRNRIYYCMKLICSVESFRTVRHILSSHHFPRRTASI